MNISSWSVRHPVGVVMLTLAAMVLGIGMLVDSTIVMLETSTATSAGGSPAGRPWTRQAGR